MLEAYYAAANYHIVENFLNRLLQVTIIRNYFFDFCQGESSKINGR